MPWPRRRRAALAIGLLGATALIAAAGRLRTRDTSHPLDSIDNTLTRDASGCAGVRSTVWHPLSGVEYTGRLRITLPARLGGAIALFVGDAMPLDLEASTETGAPVLLQQERLPWAPGIHVPPDFWLDDGSPLVAPRQINRVTVDALSERQRTVTMSLGRRAPRVLARLIGYPADVRVPVCADPVRRGETYFGTGWYGQEVDGTEGPIRWMREYGAVLVSSADGHAARVQVRLAPAVADAAESTLVRVRINDVYEPAPLPLRAGFADYEWSVPDEAWVPGTNEVLFTVSRTRSSGTRTLGLALASLHVQ